MKVISGGNSNRFDAHINHKKYCDHWNIDYEFYLDPIKKPSYYIKLDAILDSFNTHDKVLYVDDDAFFIDKNWDCKSVFDENESYDLIVTQGPKVKHSRGLFNSGVMFLRKSDSIVNLLKQVPFLNRKVYIKEWNVSEWGLPGNDYDNARLIYLTQIHMKEKVKIIDYPGFNCKENDSHRLSSPIVHFMGTRKEGKIKRFTEVTGISLP